MYHLGTIFWFHKKGLREDEQGLAGHGFERNYGNDSPRASEGWSAELEGTHMEAERLALCMERTAYILDVTSLWWLEAVCLETSCKAPWDCQQEVTALVLKSLVLQRTLMPPCGRLQPPPLHWQSAYQPCTCTRPGSKH